MADETKSVKIENLPKTKNEALKVELVPIPSGDNPWRTKADYKKEQRQNNIKFVITIISLIISIVSVVATSVVAIITISNMAKGNF